MKHIFVRTISHGK